MAGLSKSRLVAHRQCPRRLWLQVNRPELAAEAQGVVQRMATGTKIGELARTLHPAGVLVDAEDLSQAIEDTRRHLAGKKRPIFEATFRESGVLVRADLLLPVRGGHRIVEVKSTAQVKDYHYEDVAIQSWVARKAGVRARTAEIAHIDTSFVYPGGGDYAGLFRHEDVTAEAEDLWRAVPAWICEAQKTLAGEEPQVEPGNQCSRPFDCPFFAHCCPQAQDEKAYPPEVLPHTDGKALAARLRAEGYTDLRDVPEDRLTKPKHRRIFRATRTGTPELDPKAASVLRQVGYPRYYLDFETLGPAIPRWTGTRPFAQVPFQWSCHVEPGNGDVTHREFLAEGTGDPRRRFVESLLETLGTRGPVLVYGAGFEGGRLRELAATFPRFAGAIEGVLDRLVDLLPIAREHYYHRDMYGSWSIKAVLPTIAPDLSYAELEIGDGELAQTAFTEILDPKTDPARRKALRTALLAYCERDTWAMVCMARHFEGR